ncbi:MAG: hypothetical protein H0U70_12995 [Tatlockia sp.]|nr:hypothetical protein [Tatlockia sp.]
MLISPFLVIMNKFLPIFSQEQFKQLPDLVQADFSSLYIKLSQFFVQNKLCERYSENERAILTDEEIESLAAIVKERALALASQIKNVNPENLLLGNTLFEEISALLITDTGPGVRNPTTNDKHHSTYSINKVYVPLKHRNFKSQAQVINQPTKNESPITGPFLNRVFTPLKNRDFNLEPQPISKKSNAQAEALQLPLTAIKFTKEEKFPVLVPLEPLNLEQPLDQFFNKQNLESDYNRAKKELAAVHKTFQVDLKQLNQAIYDTNYYSFKPEEKAIKALEKIFRYHSQVSEYLFSRSSMEITLKAVRTEIEFVNPYLINESLFNEQIVALEKCKEACRSILLSKSQKSGKFKIEAKDLIDSIKNYLLPTSYFNFAVYNFKTINNQVLVAIENESLANLDEWISNLEKSINHLKNSSDLLKNSKYVDEFIIITNFLAKSYEDLADLKSKKVDLMLEQNHSEESLFTLLKEIKANYHESNSYISDQQVWLSILYTQHRLIEAFTKKNNRVEGLKEINNLMDEILKKGLATNEESSTTLEILYYMLYACSKASSLSNTSSIDFQQKALNFMSQYKAQITKIDFTCDLENLSAEIIAYLVQLKLLPKGGEWNLQSAINGVYNFSQQDNQTSGIDSIVYVKEKTTVIINYKDSANTHNNQNEFMSKGIRSGFFQKQESQQNSQSDLNKDRGFQP